MYFTTVIVSVLSIPQCVVHSLYRSSTRGPEDDSVESKHVAPISHCMFNIITVVFDGPSPPFSVTNSQVREKYPTNNRKKEGELDWLHLV